MAKLNLKDEITVPEGIGVTIVAPLIKVSGPNGDLERRMSHPMIAITSSEGKITFELKNGTKREKMMMKTFEAHLKNMIAGATENYTYRLRVCSSHFPMTVTKEGNKITVKNFLGEKVPREAKIPEGVEVDVKGTEITVTGPSKEKTGQAAANIERSTRLTNKDRRKFQDGIYITEKAGVEL
jgi:large subunit ribosomal protein L6